MTVTRIRTVASTRVENVAPPQIAKADANLIRDRKVVENPGKPGQARVTYTVTVICVGIKNCSRPGTKSGTCNV